ncbi:acetyl/propionyl/methylcrotonyl-CoA carboxylase subunit alpha [Sneathiella aquimaris]|uniref:acetyl/propionyl/methylcrotonyl-CoA carboxylase subunit alpha n=1 Tax=Sneathiella aquimaris TaxID=2599305 RepID=UPI00146B4C0A|nr:acetyl-CoA carboxylase biotin carboxylase subunit [Sneathiella aquimaris]
MVAFSKILIANRGEIACRIIRTAHDMGFETVAVFSDADRDAPHVQQASEAVAIGPAAASDSYLKIDTIIAAAKTSGADAIHPGYGFLSENANFAAACQKENITFIGPSPSAISLMGNKAEAKRRMIEAGVPCVPGYEGEDQSDALFIQAADAIEYPVMVKAAAGGGGRGMRLVNKAEKLEKALSAARSEAQNAFGSDELILEKAVIEPRHIEIQIFADMHGNVVHLGERDCSIQRRHQKVIEEAPSPAVSASLRSQMGAAAVAAAKAIQYSGAGTVEFLLSQDGSFYFLEMNTRLQVEHPVTECITGFDLVEWQLRVARQEKLPVDQNEIHLSGHAIEARLYAEDPYKSFLPKVGTLLKWEAASGPDRRTDHGLKNGYEVTPHYDAMIAKVIAWGQTREDARQKLIHALQNTVDLGLVTNRQFLINCLKHENFAAGAATTAFIDTYFPKKVLKRPEPTSRDLLLAACLHFDCRKHQQGLSTDGWDSSDALWAPVRLNIADKIQDFEIKQIDECALLIKSENQEYSAQFSTSADGHATLACEGHQTSARFAFSQGTLFLQTPNCQFSSNEITLATGESEAGAGDGRILAPMNGRLLHMLAEPGQSVTKGQTVAILEAMKMEHEITSKIDGTVKSIAAKADEQVATRALLLEIEPVEA